MSEYVYSNNLSDKEKGEREREAEPWFKAGKQVLQPAQECRHRAASHQQPHHIQNSHPVLHLPTNVLPQTCLLQNSVVQCLTHSLGQTHCGRKPTSKEV